MTTIPNIPPASFCPAQSNDPPLFLRVVAPPDKGEVASYHLTLIQQPVGYGIHWSKKPDGGADRYLCTGDDCLRCAEGHKAQEMFAGLCIDHAAPRFAIVQISRAASSHIIRAGMDYLKRVREDDPEAKVRSFGLEDPEQPSFRICARREAAGPRYEAKASPRLITFDPITEHRLGLADWFDTDAGAAWLKRALAKTNPAIRSFALRPDLLDPMPLIWPVKPDWASWDSGGDN